MANSYQYKVLKNADAVFSITEKICNSVKERYDIPVILNKVGLNLKNIDKNGKYDYLITISNWSVVKSPFKYIELMKKLPNYLLIMGGNWVDDNFKEEFKNKIIEENVNIILKEHLTETEKYDLLSHAKVLIRFEEKERGIGIGPIEALETLTPVIVNDDLGISLDVEKYGLGLVIKNWDYSVIPNFLKDLESNEYRLNIIENIKKYIKDNSWSKHCEILISPFEK